MLVRGRESPGGGGKAGGMSTYHIEVTQEDIDNGKRGQWEHCPVALAAIRCLSNSHPIQYLSVTQKYLYLFGLDDAANQLPDSATDFIKRFDGCEDVEPFAFDIDLPAELEAAQ